MDTCGICVTQFNKSTRAPVECKGCDFICCRSCCKTYILGLNDEAICMNCKKPWDREFLVENLTKVFVNKDLKNHLENVFVEKQISLLPETQDEAIKTKRIRDINARITEATTTLNKYKEKIKKQSELIKDLQYSILDISGQTYSKRENNYSFKCPHEECKGFLNKNYNCELCDNSFCSRCLCLKEEHHECDEELVETVKQIKKQAKPCPSCGEMISKIDGCDQMWCVTCHVQFSWNTGNIQEGYNHNPEYFRWMRESGQFIERNPRENNCERIITQGDITSIIPNLFPGNRAVLSSFLEIYRYYLHLIYAQRQNTFEADNDNALLKLRVNYLLGDITKEEWKFKLQKLNKNFKKNKDYKNVKLLVHTVIESYMQQIIDFQYENEAHQKYLKILEVAENFRMYANNQFIKISDTYGSSSCPGISKNWNDILNLKATMKMAADNTIPL